MLDRHSKFGSKETICTKGRCLQSDDIFFLPKWYNFKSKLQEMTDFKILPVLGKLSLKKTNSYIEVMCIMDDFNFNLKWLKKLCTNNTIFFM